MDSGPNHQIFHHDQAPSTIPSDTSNTDGPTEHRPFACPFPGCTSAFKRKNAMKDHMNIHTGERPFVCPVESCGKRFATSGNLSRHKRLHPWLDKPLQCLVDGCGCEFPNDEKLQRHMLSHFDDSGDYRCDIGTCGRVFSSTGNLRRHIKQYHSDVTGVATMEGSPGPPAELMDHTSLSPLPHPLPMNWESTRDPDILEALSYLIDESKDEIDDGSEEKSA